MLGKIDPRLTRILRAYPSAEIKVIVEALGDRGSLESLVRSRNGSLLDQALRYVAVKIQAARLKELAEDNRVARIWHVCPEIYDPYFNMLKAVEHILSLSDGPKIINLSLGPPIERPGSLSFDPDEPVNIATKRLFDHGTTVVVAVGNYGRLGNDTLNPWSVAPWVIGVGAATQDGKKLADFSSRGRPRDPLYRPTVVGPGVDMIVAHTSDVRKTPEQLEKDRQFIPEDDLDQYTVVSGTSMAAGNVSGAIANVMGFMDEHIEQGHDHMEIEVSVGGYRKTIRFKVGTLPLNIKYFMMQFAMPMPAYEPHEVGAGFISRSTTEQCFGDHASKIQLYSYKIL